jgi:dihydroxy-acid dehydratase
MALDHWDISRTRPDSVRQFLPRRARRGAHDRRPSRPEPLDALDLDREGGVIRSKEHAFSQDGGLAVLKGNLAPTAAS